MIRLALAAVLAFLTIRAHRTADRRDERALSGARARLALAVLAQAAALVPLAYGVAPALRMSLLQVGALAGVVAWEAFAQLLAAGGRKLDAGVRIFWLGVAAITLATPAPWGVAAAFAILGSLAFRWRHAVPTRRKYLLVIAAIALSVAGFFRVGSLAGPVRPDALPDLEQQLWAVATATRLALAVLSSLGAYVLLLAIVRDPSLGIRTVGRRLGLSHSLVLLVPVALLLALWMATTVLGVNRDRALVATRALQAEATQLHTGLQHALDSGTPSAVSALADSWNGIAPGVRAYVVERGRAQRVAGEALGGADTAVVTWLASRDSLPASTLVTLGGRTWIAAAAGSGARGAVVVVPADSLVTQMAGPASGGTARLTTDLGGVIVPERDSVVTVRADPRRVGATVDSVLREAAVAAADSSAADAAEEDDTPGADSLPANQLHTSVSVGGNRFRMDNQQMSASQFLLEGHAFVPAMGWRHGKWTRGQLLLSVTLPPREILRGMYRNSDSDPMGYIPMVLLIALGVLLSLVALWDILMVTNMSRGVATAIGALRDAARKLEGGDLTHRIELRGDDDLWDVARAVNQAAEGLQRAQAAEKDRARMESELAVARRIQSRLLPAAAPRVPGLEIAGMSQPALEVGGDYFDHIDMGDGRVALVIADVSGKGVPAALLMSAFRAALVSHDLRREEPAALAERLNDFLHRSMDPGKFVTAFIAFLDSASGDMQFVNAGHNPSLLTRADGTHEWLSEGGTILGILPMSVFAAGRVTLQPGDVLTLYTDGVTEGADASKEQWGEDRLVAALERLREKPCAEIARSLVTEVRAFEGDSGPADDITVIVARRAT